MWGYSYIRRASLVNRSRNLFPEYLVTNMADGHMEFADSEIM